MGKGSYSGEMTGNGSAEKFAKPQRAQPAGVLGMTNTKNDIGEKSGFNADTSSYIDKKGTPYGEAAKFNFLPPGMDITEQENAEFNNMPMKTLTSISYPGDGWGSMRDIPE